MNESRKWNRVPSRPPPPRAPTTQKSLQILSTLRSHPSAGTSKIHFCFPYEGGFRWIFGSHSEAMLRKVNLRWISARLGRYFDVQKTNFAESPRKSEIQIQGFP